MPKFALTWLVEVAHDDTNELYKADYDLYNFFLKNREKFSNSFIIFLGDHGPRFGKESKTPVNDAEQRNPFLYIVLPEHLRYSPMHKQLMMNSKELLTHHDLHATLKDILYFQPASNFTDMNYKVFDSNKRGSSVLRRYEEGVKRNCKTLPIPFQYCICQYVTTTVQDEGMKHKLGSFAASQLDLLLKTEGVSSMCESIKLGRVVEVSLYGSALNSDHETFRVTFAVAPPAHGTFKVLVRKERSDLHIGGKYIRLDWYGSSADCMSRDVLRPYCTCKNFCAFLPTLCRLYGHIM